MSAIFQYRVLGRTQWAWPGLAAGLIMLALATHAGAPFWIWALLLPCLGVCLMQVAFRPIYGIRMSPALLEVFDGFREEMLPLAQIAYLRINGREARIVLHNGSEMALPPRAVPNPLALIGEMTARDIPVRQN
jgi:hypothetical protein